MKATYALKSKKIGQVRSLRDEEVEVQGDRETHGVEVFGQPP